MIDKEALRQVAAGEINDPRIEMEVDGNSVIAEGVHAKYFALGILAGLKAAHPDSVVNVDNEIKT